MKPGRIACLALGLPAAMLTHFWLFGNEHVLGGRLHGAFVELAVCLTAGVLAAGLALALRSRARLLPNAGLVAAASAGWFAGIELCERAHSIGLFPAAVAIVVSACVVTAAFRCFSQAAIFVADALAPPFRLDGAAGLTRIHRRERALKFSAPLAFSLFSRPPPSVA